MKAWPIDLGAWLRKRWTTNLRGRLGGTIPPVQPGSVWIHGASLGEVRIGRRLADHLPNAFVTADTDAGCTLADSPRPWDHPWSLAPLWSEARPRLLVFVEGSWWPALATMARRHGVPVVAVAARFHARRRWMHHALGWPDAVWAVSEADAAGFRKYMKGVRVSGSLKGFAGGANPLDFARRPLVGVCTHAPEERALVEAWQEIMPSRPLLLAPRRLERVPELLRQFPAARRRTDVGERVEAGELVLLDTLGELPALLQGAAVAFVGGTFDPVIAGHSPMEARAGGAVVVHGPCTANNREGFVGSVAISSLAELSAGLLAALGQNPIPVVDRAAAVADELLALAGPPAPESAPRPWARPVAVGHLVKMRVRSERVLPSKVVTVGSRGARGVGKSTLAAFIARGLAREGLRVAIVTRGVGATVSRGDSSVNGADAAYLGDEGAWLASLGFRVVAGPWPWALERLADVDRVVLEDGLQAGRAHRSVEIVDGRFPSARGPFPMGEDRGLCVPADVRVWVRALPQGLGGSREVKGVFRMRAWSGEPSGGAVAFAGIGRNVDFFSTLKGLDIQDVRGFPDHHRYTRADRLGLLAWAEGRTLLTTSRDATRLPARFPVVHRDVELRVPDFPWDRVL